ncbi:hypothetical protein ARAM_004808 [Aspergillus rambellii]|uniref:Structure-specific endonuclease subunit SLX4 n=1 Tax=Aspergillus rambellii TaxID=308745 RepID=A0A0F8X3G7_9EURO|nr:hypothetical protein ARAM_004808 [Aspergillus rambellii]
MKPTADVIILSSSPERIPIHTPVPLEHSETSFRLSARCQSSSPVLSPSELFEFSSRSRFFAATGQTRPDKPGSNAQDTTVEEPTARIIDGAPAEDKPQRRGRKHKNAPQSVTGVFDESVSGNKEKALTKPNTTRKKRTNAGPQREKLTNKTITGKVAKSGTVKSKESHAKAVDEQATSKPARGRSPSKEPEHDWEKDGLQLETALKRRLDWTPVKETTKSVAELDDEDGTERGSGTLSILVSEYEYNGNSSTWKNRQTFEESNPTKRRRIELVDSRIIPYNGVGGENTRPSAVSKQEKKPMKRAKKLTTLTARVTAAYHNESTESLESATEDTSVAGKNTTGRGSRSGKTKKKANQNAEFKVPRTIVLSPEAAVRSLDDQDLIFGTCSQLEREDSPTLLVQTQTAIQESEGELISATGSRLNQSTRFGQPSSTTVSRFTTPRNLWSFASRDAEGLLVEAEVLDLVKTPEALEIIAPRNDHYEETENEGGGMNDNNKKVDIPPAKAPAASASTAIDKELPVSSTKIIKQTGSKRKAATKPSIPHYSGFTDPELAKEVSRYGLKAIKNRKKMIEILEKCWVAKHGPSTQEEDRDTQETQPAGPELASTLIESEKAEKRVRKPRAPQKKARTQAQPKTSLPAKGGGNMCLTTINLSGPIANFTLETEKSQQPTRSFIDVDEIQDSEEELIPSPSRVQSKLLPQPQARQKLPTSAVPSSPIPTRPTSQSRSNSFLSDTTNCHENPLPDLGKQIAKAVRAQPRQSSARNHSPQPSWQEKILMYDPIFLEDFTTWLNTEGFSLVNEDREVSASFVREWCENRGICCCNKVRNS